ncbi:MarR family winged helix-turn-helix transcriptional regulator [Hyphococcus luteus]|uniref:MarR family transcriptional regulator n=1 Tax=Hyphococcus luteus TaxID=2058213 RepID=A0A2S7K2D9_9PROT|nr:MarR family transcriptional regulator [Marinicaulis flavus]PQA86649.1 MarR family transcriptional regulator [Marinicaulis flavus]
MEKRDNRIERNPGYLVNDVARLLRREFDRRVKHIGLTRAQWFVIAHLYRNDGRTQRALADELDMEPAPLGRLVDRLEESGWVRRAPAPGDRRANLVYLTDKIFPMIEDMRTAANNLYKDAFKGLSAKRVEDFIETLTIAKSNLVELGAAPAANSFGGVDPLHRVQRKIAKSKG